LRRFEGRGEEEEEDEEEGDEASDSESEVVVVPNRLSMKLLRVVQLGGGRCREHQANLPMNSSSWKAHSSSFVASIGFMTLALISPRFTVPSVVSLSSKS